MKKNNSETFFFYKNCFPLQDDPEGELRIHIGICIFVQ